MQLTARERIYLKRYQQGTIDEDNLKDYLNVGVITKETLKEYVKLGEMSEKAYGYVTGEPYERG